MKANVNKSIALIMLAILPEEKRKTLSDACDRNNYLTSFYGLPEAKLEIYKEGFYLKLEGTRCNFSVYAKDNDGDLEILQRKPRVLSYLYTDSFKMSESDYRNLHL